MAPNETLIKGDFAQRKSARGWCSLALLLWISAMTAVPASAGDVQFDISALFNADVICNSNAGVLDTTPTTATMCS
jgi:hypothetical protein